jgi:hypothetical protein
LVCAHSFHYCEQEVLVELLSSGCGTWIASAPTMTDEKYLSLLLWTICVLMFACGVMAITEHPDWFGA